MSPNEAQALTFRIKGERPQASIEACEEAAALDVLAQEAASRPKDRSRSPDAERHRQEIDAEAAWAEAQIEERSRP